LLFLFNNLLFPLFLKYLQNKSFQVIKLKGFCSHIILYKRRFFPCNNRFHFFDILICSHSNPLFFNSLTQVTHNTHILSEVLLDRDIVFISNFILMSSKLHFRYEKYAETYHTPRISQPYNRLFAVRAHHVPVFPGCRKCRRCVSA
jgi:hypothetical protein